MPRFNFNNITLQDTADITKVMENFTEIENNGITNAEVTAAVNTLNTAINGKAASNHASSATTYGVGTSSNYGHCKIVNNLTTASHSDGVGLSAYQGKVLNDAIGGKQKTITKGTSTPTGGSSGDIYIQYFA